MGEKPTFQTDAVDWSDIGDQLMSGAMKAAALGKLSDAAVSMLTKQKAAVGSFIFDTVVEFALKMGEAMHKVEEASAPAVAAFIAPVIAGLFGAQINEDQFARRLSSGGGAAPAGAIVDGFMAAIAGDGNGAAEPSDAGARRLARAAVAASLESGVNATITEMLSDMLGEFGPRFTALTELPEGVIRTLGVGRLVRRALAPAIDASCATPAKWYYAKQYRQTLLGASDVARQVARGRWSIDQATEELSRAGYSDDRIEAVLNAAAKFLSASDLGRLVRAQQMDPGEAIQQLREAGYDETTAATVMLLERLAFIEELDRAMADAAVTAFADGRIDEGTLAGFCSGTTITEQHKAQLVELAHARRVCNRKSLSSADAAAAVEAGILAYVDYRAALVREGYDDDAVTVKELLLRQRLDSKKSAAEHKAALAAEKAAAAAKAQADALAKKQAADAKAAAAHLGPPAQLEDAYIRGLIPLSRVQQVYATRYDADTVGILSDLVESRRQAYLAQQAAADAAKQRAKSRGLDVGQLETAVLTGALTVDEFARRLTELQFDPADIGVLVGTVNAKLAAQRAAQAAHDAAVAAAKVKHIDLPTLELLVRRGHRTLDDFRQTLTALGYDDVAQAALVERLQIQMADDAAAAKLRADAAARLATKGLSLDELRRAVVLGFKTTQDYAAALLAAKVTPDAVATLVQEVEFDAAQAKAAADRRAATAARSQARDAPLADVHRAARLGLIPVSVYTDRLTADGYTDDAIALELDLLTTEIADTQAARAKRGAADASATGAGLTLAQTAAAVKLNELPIASYTDRALALGFSADDAATLTRVLQDEIDADAALRARKAALAAENGTRELARADMVKAVTDGLKTIDDYGAWLRAAGYGEDDAALLVAELQQQLDATAGATTTP